MNPRAFPFDIGSTRRGNMSYLHANATNVNITPPFDFGATEATNT